MSGTTIKFCDCKGPGAEFQDKLYSKNMRLVNLREDGKSGKCTVCGAKK